MSGNPLVAHGAKIRRAQSAATTECRNQNRRQHETKHEGNHHRVSFIECSHFSELGGLVSARKDQERILIISRPGEEGQIGKVQEELYTGGVVIAGRGAARWTTQWRRRSLHALEDASCHFGRDVSDLLAAGEHRYGVAEIPIVGLSREADGERAWQSPNALDVSDAGDHRNPGQGGIARHNFGSVTSS